MPNLTMDVVEGIYSFKLCSYLVALEGWRRGLKLTWYKDESPVFNLGRLGNSTQGKFFSLTSETKTHYFHRSQGDGIANESINFCRDKSKTNNRLDEAGVPVPKGVTLDINDERIFEYAENLEFPIVIKPLDGSMGRGVYTNIRSSEELRDVKEDFKKTLNYKTILMEKYYEGKEYRMYVAGDRFVGATNRVPANVTGDSKHSISELIKIKNKARRGNPYLRVKPIKVDYEVKLNLKRRNLNLESIPSDGETIYLRTVSNLSTGGDPIESTDELTEEVKEVAVNAFKALPAVPHGGIDIIVDSNDNTKCVVLEINTVAEIGFHVFPWSGKAKDVPGAIIDYYFPETIDSKKSLSYFDYHSAIEPLKSWAAEEVTIAPALNGDIYTKKINIFGEFRNMIYMNLIRRKALASNLHGSARSISKNEIEITIIGHEEETIKKFAASCKKGFNKIKVKSVKEQKIYLEEKPVKLGFEIIREEKNKKNVKNTADKIKIRKLETKLEKQKLIESKNNDFISENKILKDEIMKLKKENKNIINSTSWKLSSPIRKIGSIRKKLKSKK